MTIYFKNVKNKHTLKKITMKVSKNCAVRLEPELHRLTKLRAYELGLTLQEYIKQLIERDLQKEKK